MWRHYEMECYTELCKMVSIMRNGCFFFFMVDFDPEEGGNFQHDFPITL